MIPLIKRLGFAGIRAIPLKWLKAASPIRVISPFHHLVSDEPVPYIEKLYAFKNSRQFEADLDYLLRHFRPLSLEEVIQQEKTGQPFEQPGFLICFDDGLRSVYETAAPILLRKGVPAAFFINPAFVDNKDIFYNFKKGLILDKFDRTAISESTLAEGSRLLGQKFANPVEFRTSIRSVNYLNRHLMDNLGNLFQLDFDTFRKEQRPFMTTQQIKELIGKGFGVGSHSIAFPHIDTGVGHTFFQALVGGPSPEMDLLMGNSTGMLEAHARTLHRFIGENPAIPIEAMVKSVMAYGAVRKKIGRPFVQRTK